MNARTNIVLAALAGTTLSSSALAQVAPGTDPAPGIAQPASGQPSGSLQPEVPICVDGTRTADWNADQRVNSSDVLAFLNDFDAGNPRADLTNDGALHSDDLLAYFAMYAEATRANTLQPGIAGGPSEAVGEASVGIAQHGAIADWNGDGEVHSDDYLAYMNDFVSQEPRADLTGDGAFFSDDILAFVAAFDEAMGEQPTTLGADWNGDGRITSDDFLAFFNDWTGRIERADLAEPIGAYDAADVLEFLNLYAIARS
ncbi:MAG: GC-type dockerin domain-anchored protein [Phycisphaerales bacterium]|jgi:hypothetical protein|nr:GC-type dockerin domain-anchored protein [Phycisphaerales bacterium]